MKKFIFSILLTFLFSFFSVPIATAAESLVVPSTAPSGQNFLIEYFGLNTDKCYSFQVVNSTTGEFHHARTGNATSCTNNGNDYYSSKPPRSDGQLNIEWLAAGVYKISLYQGQSLKVQQSITIIESGITPSNAPSPLPTARPLNCDNRPSNCSKSEFPQCQQTSQAIICGSEEHSCTINSGSSRYCAYRSDVTMPPATQSNSCNNPRLEGGEIVADRCASGWQCHDPAPQNGTTTDNICIPNTVTPTPDPEEVNKCPICNDGDYSNYLSDAACHKDSGTSSDSIAPEYEICSPDQCTAGKGCFASDGSLKTKCPICPPEKPYYKKTGEIGCYANPNFLDEEGSTTPTGSDVCSAQYCKPGKGCNLSIEDEIPPCKIGFKYQEVNGKTTRIPIIIGDEMTKEELKSLDGCLEVNTAIGGINTSPTSLIRSIMAILLSVSGGIALILIIISGYKLMASRGDPEKLQGAKDRLTSAIIGLLFIIFSLVIVEVIGVDILAIPGFGK